MRRTLTPTLKDVALEVGVTAMTVSAVLHGGRSGTRVSDTTRIRIEEAAARLNYRRNAVARGLSRRRMDTLGVISIIDSDEVNLYFLEVLNGILAACARCGQNTNIFSISDWQQDQQKILDFTDGRVDGMIFVGPMFTAEFAETLLHHTPFVTLHSNGVMPHTYNLDVDNEAGAHQIVQYLIAQGHRRIACFSGGDPSGPQQRMDGYRRALAEAGIAYDESLVIHGELTAASGQARMTAVLERGLFDPFPTALFCDSDGIASGCMQAMAAHGLRVPGDISVAGFDDLMISRMTSPPLTTIRQPFRAMGQRAVDLLLQQIYRDTPAADAEGQSFADTAELTGPHTEVFDTEFIVRASIGPPRVHRVLLGAYEQRADARFGAEGGHRGAVPDSGGASDGGDY